MATKSAKIQPKSVKPKPAPVNQSSEEVSYDIITTDAWDAKDHVCGLAKPNKNGQGKSFSLTYKKKRFYLKIPKMYCPFGAQQPKLKAGEVAKENPTWGIQLSFTDDANNQTFQQKCTEFDEFIINEAMKPENQVSWLGASKSKPFSREVVESKYTPMLKYVKKDGEVSNEYPPFVRANFPTDFKPPHGFQCEIYNKDNVLQEPSIDPKHPSCISKIIPEHCSSSALLSGSGWANNTGFGVTWKIQQTKFFPARGTLPKGKCLVDDPDEDEEEEGENDEKDETQTDTTPDVDAETDTTDVSTDGVAPDEVDETEEVEEVEEVEEEVEEVPEPTPVPEPVVAKIAPKVGLAKPKPKPTKV